MWFTPDNVLKEMYHSMANLTKKQCEKDCFRLDGHIGSCCSKMYCEMALELASKWGVSLEKTDNQKLPLMGESGCVAPPWLRPLCTLHICDKSLFDADFSRAYFNLKAEIDTHEDNLYTSQKETIQ